jgi:multiple sugar transport system ATP-binding protein
VLGVRAEDLTLVAVETAPFRGKVFTCELTGEAALVTLKLGQQLVTAKADKSYRAKAGESCGLSAMSSSCYLFDAATELRLRLD